MEQLNSTNISCPDDRGYQVRIKRDGNEIGRYFPFNKWGSKKKALEVAQNWRDQVRVVFCKPVISIQINTRKKTTGVRGVSRSVQCDKRCDITYVVYSAHWRTHGKPRTKSFQVGRIEEVTADEEFHAFRTAVRFRNEYKICVEESLSFDPIFYKNWKNERLYESRTVIALPPSKNKEMQYG